MFINKPIPKFFILLFLINLPFVVFLEGGSNFNSDFLLSFFGCINGIFVPLLLLNSISSIVNEVDNKDEENKKIKNKAVSPDFEETGNCENQEYSNNHSSEKDRILDNDFEQDQTKKEKEIKYIDYTH